MATKVAIITCYKHPDYGRAVTLRAALQANPDVETIIIKNSHRGFLRYPEVMIKSWRVKRQQKPDVYLLTFRGYEMLPFILLLAGKQPVIFDELINPLEVVAEHRQQQRGLVGLLMLLWSAVGGIYKLFVRRCRVVIADTQVHANHTAKLSKLKPVQLAVIPVGADETIFKPVEHQPDKDFEVLFFGNMVPLHGLRYILSAAIELKDRNIDFRLVGGNQKVVERIEQAQVRGAKIEHQAWLEPLEIAKAIARADLCLGGPFGNTLQSQLVITGKTFQSLACASLTLVGQSDAITQGGFKDKTNCLVVPQASSADLAKAILWAKEHPAELSKIGHAGRKLYQDKFSQKVINKELTTLLTGLTQPVQP